MADMKTDNPVLIKEAANFDRISGELQGIMGHVEGSANALKAQLNSEGAGAAAQNALIRFHEAAEKVRQELADISNNIHTSATQYQSTDDDQASALHSQMNI
ncbi:WXG100 family type VII secretion target [Mycolicibacterium boenickei]